MKLLLNPLSANQQCNSVRECFEAIQLYVEFCDYCLPALTKKRILLFYDMHMDQRSLVNGIVLAASLADCRQIPGGKDLVSKWYIYTRNRSKPLAVGTGVDIQLSTSSVVSAAINGTVHQSTLDELELWISLPGDPICNCQKLTINREASTREIQNAADIVSLKAWLPSYEPNPKHRPEAYYADGELISPMPLSDMEALTLLLTSAPDISNGCRWAYHTQSKEYYCYRATYPGREIYHGYCVPKESVPRELVDII